MINVADCKIVAYNRNNVPTYCHEATSSYFYIRKDNGRKQIMYQRVCENCSAVDYTSKSGSVRCHTCGNKHAGELRKRNGKSLIYQLRRMSNKDSIGSLLNGTLVYKLSNGNYYSRGRDRVSRVYKVTCPTCSSGNWRFAATTRLIDNQNVNEDGLVIYGCISCGRRTGTDAAKFASERFRNIKARHLAFGDYTHKLTRPLIGHGTAVALGGENVGIELHRLAEYNEHFKTIRIYDFTAEDKLAANIKQQVEVCNLTSIERTYVYNRADMFMADTDMVLDNDLVFASIDTQRQMTEELIYDVSQYLLAHGSDDKPLSFLLNTVNRSRKKGKGMAPVRSDRGWARLLQQLTDNGYEVQLDLGRTTYNRGKDNGSGNGMNLYGATVIPRVRGN